MNKTRSRFWTFIFSLIPGAGEMYLGFMQNGMSIMILFLVYFAVSVFLRMEELLIITPAFWFYSFFHVHNLARMTPEEQQQVEDKPILLASAVQDLKLNRSIMRIVAIGLIAFGGIYTVKCLLLSLGRYFYMWDLYYMVTEDLMQVVIGILIVAAGVYMIRGKRFKQEQEEAEEKEQ